MKTGKTQQALLAVALVLGLVFLSCGDGNENDEEDTNNSSQTDGNGNNGGNSDNGGNNGGNGGSDNGNGSNGGNDGISLITSIAYGNGKFIAVGGTIGYEIIIAYSADGVNWTKAASHPFGTGLINSVAWGNGKFVAVGSGSNDKRVIANSTDGVIWTEVTTAVFPNRDIYVIVWGADKFVIAGQYGSHSGMAYSADGVTWADVPNTSNALGSSVVIEQLGWGDGKFVAGTNNMAYSTDGITWTKAANNPFGAVMIDSHVASGNIYDFAWGNGKYVAVGYYNTPIAGYQNTNGRIAYSTDANNWAVAEDTTFGKTTVFTVTWGNGRFVAGGIGGKMAYSTDGVTWTAVANSKFGDAVIRDIAWGNDKFVAVGSQSKIAYSTDGIIWTAVANSPFP